MKKFLFYFALTGWTLGLIVHLFSVAGINVSSKVPFIWVLHMGIFVVWLPAILELKKNVELKELQQSSLSDRMNPSKFFNIIFKNTPGWLIVIAMGGFIYAFINFILFISSQHGTTDIQDGQFVLQNHGNIIRVLTEQEYHHYKANEIRGFSGHWMAFYGIAAAVLFNSVKTTENNLTEVAL